jgi:hypothetical protein
MGVAMNGLTSTPNFLVSTELRMQVCVKKVFGKMAKYGKMKLIN